MPGCSASRTPAEDPSFSAYYLRYSNPWHKQGTHHPIWDAIPSLGFPFASRKDFSRPGCALSSETMEVTLCFGRRHSRDRKRRDLTLHPSHVCSLCVRSPSLAPASAPHPPPFESYQRDAYHSLSSRAGSPPCLCDNQQLLESSGLTSAS